MKILHCISYIDVIGTIWVPGVTGAYRYTLTGYDIENIRGYSNRDADDPAAAGLPITREGVELWLGCHAGDFASVTDFTYSIEDGNDSVESEWGDPDSEFAYNDAMYGTD